MNFQKIYKSLSASFMYSFLSAFLHFFFIFSRLIESNCVPPRSLYLAKRFTRNDKKKKSNNFAINKPKSFTNRKIGDFSGKFQTMGKRAAAFVFAFVPLRTSFYQFGIFIKFSQVLSSNRKYNRFNSLMCGITQIFTVR